MRVIDSKNLDEWLFDFFEGNLKPDEKDKLTNFLHSNPARKSDYNAWKNCYITEQEIVYPNMDSLLKNEGFGKKWAKWGLALIMVLGVSLAYMFYTNKTTDKTSNPINNSRNTAPPAKETSETPQPISLEKNNVNMLIEKKKEPIYPATKEVIIAPPTKVEKQVDFLEPEKVLESETRIEPENPLIQEKKLLPKDTVTKVNKAVSDTLQNEKNKKKTKKEMKIIKLKNTGF